MLGIMVHGYKSHLVQFDASKMRLGARALRKRLHLRL